MLITTHRCTHKDKQFLRLWMTFTHSRRLYFLDFRSYNLLCYDVAQTRFTSKQSLRFDFLFCSVSWSLKRFNQSKTKFIKKSHPLSQKKKTIWIAIFWWSYYEVISFPMCSLYLNVYQQGNWIKQWYCSKTQFSFGISTGK